MGPQVPTLSPFWAGVALLTPDLTCGFPGKGPALPHPRHPEQVRELVSYLPPSLHTGPGTLPVTDFYSTPTHCPCPSTGPPRHRLPTKTLREQQPAASAEAGPRHAWLFRSKTCSVSHENNHQIAEARVRTLKLLAPPTPTPMASAVPRLVISPLTPGNSADENSASSPMCPSFPKLSAFPEQKQLLSRWPPSPRLHVAESPGRAAGWGAWN